MIHPSPSTPASRTEDQVAKAMSSPLRLRMLAALNERVASPKQLADDLGESLPKLCYHVKVLRDLGCIELVDTRRRRGATEHFYRATTRAMIDSEASDVLPLPARQAISSTILQVAFGQAHEAIAAGTFDARTDRHLSQVDLTLTETGWRTVNMLLDEVLERALALQAKALAPGVEPSEQIRSSLVLAHFTTRAEQADPAAEPATTGSAS
jgi:DNA-binding transcriptional ArsR family regulator